MRQKLKADAVENIEAAVAAELAAIGLAERIRPGMSVAITAGSRGFPYNVRVLRAMADEVRRVGGKPFIVPAMGSHGGATAEGQIEVLRGLGVTEDSLGCPIRSSMDTVLLGHTPDGLPVHADRNAMSADAILLFNRVKLHTDFRGRVESGLVKIMVVGLGKQVGAETAHKAGLGEAIVRMAEVFLKNAPVVGGIATVENYREEPAIIKGLPAAGLIDEEAALLRRSLDYFPRLPFDDLDVLVVDRMGKDISGNGMDTNVIGMHRRIGGSGTPDIRTIVCLDLTEGGHGNALGIGLADLIPQSMADKVDWQKTWMNGYTSGLTGVQRSRIPMVFADDREAIAAAVQMCGEVDPSRVRLVRIKNTLEVARMQISAGLLGEAAERGLSVAPVGRCFEFDSSGSLTTPSPRASALTP